MNEREAFEEWFNSEMPMESLITDQDNDYKYQPAIASWEAWKAAIALQAQQPTMRKAKPMSDAYRELLKNEFYFANDGKERDWSEQESQADKQKVLVDAITEVLRVLETDNEAIVDTVWTTRGDNETLWEHCSHALEQVTGIEYKPAEQLPLYLQSQAQQESKPVIAHEVRAYGRMQKIIVRDDVAEEYADKLKADGYANVEVRELVYALPPAPEGGDK